MKPLAFLLLFGLLAIALATWKANSMEREGYHENRNYDYEYDTGLRNEDEDEIQNKYDEHIAKKKKEIHEKIARKGISGEEETNEVEDPKRRGTESKVLDVDDNDDRPLEICDGTEAEACKCELNEVNCVNIYFDDDTRLNSMDVALSRDNKKLKNFKPILANFADNLITHLEKNRMPEGLEETLAALYLERNNIARIDKNAFEGFKNISKLNLEGNRLRTIKREWFGGDIEKTLHALSLENNKIRDTEKSPFKNLKNLKKLVLDRNALNMEKDFFEGLENLETLSLDDCDINDKDLPEGIFKPLKKLKKLSLRNNPLTEVPPALEEISHLAYLDLSETHIAELHRQSFVGEPEMQQIYFEYMPYLASIQDCAFCGLKSLKFLSFDNSSKLSIIDENAFGFGEYVDERTVELTTLRLSKSNITTLSLNMLEFEQLESFDLNQVPLNCTCDLMFLRNARFAGGGSSNARCAYPKELNGRYLDQAQVKEVCGYRYARGHRFFFALFGVISASIIMTIGYILFNKGYRFMNIRNIPMPSLPGANSAYTNLNRQEENELTESPSVPADSTPDFQPRPQMV